MSQRIMIANLGWAAKKDDYTKQWKPSTADELQPTKARYPTQYILSVLCPCVEDFAIHNLRPVLRRYHADR